MDEKFMAECLDVHQGLVDLERRVHEWFCGMAGVEVVNERGEPAPWEQPGWDRQRWREANPLPETWGAADAPEAPAEPPAEAPDTPNAPNAPHDGPADVPHAAADAGTAPAEAIDWEAQTGGDAPDEPEPEHADEPHEGAGENRPPRPAHLAWETPPDDNPWADAQ